MNKVIISVCMFLLPVISAVGQEVKFGVGAFGGLNYPILQDDQGNGTTFGFMGRFKVLPFLVAEPTVMFGKWGEPDMISGVNLGIDGSKITSFGIDATFGGAPGTLGLRPYFVLGAASYKVDNDQTGYDESNFGWSGGLGALYGFTRNIDIDIRGKAVVIPQDQGSKKAVTVTFGLVYNLGGIGVKP